MISNLFPSITRFYICTKHEQVSMSQQSSRHATTRNTLFRLKRNSAGGSQKIRQRVFWWGERGLARAGVGAEPARLSQHCTGNRFEIFRRL
ncbi:hypothetical protein CSA80_01465 [Candidatus Saccharibacteria bacterium]|nr:MAG: hypothetical protein CSA80_01465 [Candidatus Saccharibacteria bacterium]